MTDEVDIAIVGAGAAGLAAAKRLRDAPLSIIVLEARSRTGGRAHTVIAGGYPVDEGCGWLHSANRNPFVRIAESLGVVVDKTTTHWRRQAGAPNFTPEDQAAFGRAMTELDVRIDAAAAQGLDVAVSTLMDPADRWSPLLNAFSSYYNGAEFDQISVVDYAAYEDTGVNWRSPTGYGDLITRFGEGAPVMLETPVSRLDHSGPMLRLETPRGEVNARLVIVTVPTPLIAEGRTAFTPDLPAVREAAAALPLGLADKVVFAVKSPGDLPVEGHLFGSPWRTDTGSYHLRPFGRPLIEAYLAGRQADLLEAEGPGAAAAFAVEELVGIYGSDMRTRLRAVSSSSWRRETWSLGSYSHAAPGGAWARAALAEPVEERILFAGEACSANFFSTAHGAAMSGRDAAERALGLLGLE
ncbi:MAG TPA: NAD(P)/FAD-dependent oxidoreductase [Caulobacteraceae bacterium]|jgi:monoamine oxidase|nr:NAD(P)/FAD-dependent oxidoreductase [Caulobacteraceae bacterium]